MPVILDSPIHATGTPDAALMNQWARKEWVVLREQPFTGFNLATNYDPTVIPEYDFELWMEGFKQRLEAFQPIFERRVKIAQQKGLFLSPPAALLADFATGVCFFASDPNFSTLSVLLNEDGEIELSRVTANKQNVDFLSFEYDEDTDEVVVLFSRFENKRSVINTYGTLDEVIQQIVGLAKA